MPWELIWVSKDQLRLSASELNNARLDEQISEEQIDDFTTMMKAGDTFPMPGVVTSGSRFDIVTGNHRTRAGFNAGKTTIPVYHLRTDDRETIDLLVRVLNFNGRGQSRSEAVRQAHEHHIRHNVPIKDCARMFGINEKSVSKFDRANRARRRLVALIGKPVSPSEISVSTMEKLHPIANDKVMAAVGNGSCDAS